MNKLEKRALYSLVALYAGSILVIASTLGIWFYMAHKSEIEKSDSYRLELIAKNYINSILTSHELKTKPVYPKVPDTVSVAIYDSKLKRIEGDRPAAVKKFIPGYRIVGDYSVFSAKTPGYNKFTRHVIVTSNELHHKLSHFTAQLLWVFAAILIAMALLGWVLARLFLWPIHKSVEEADHFTGNVVRESNPPITALMLSSQLALEKYKSDPTIRNIYDTTRLLYNNYRSLAFLTSPQRKEHGHETDLEKVLQKVVADYTPISSRKNISLTIEESQALKCAIPEHEAELLFGNLVFNAIRHSPANTSISIWLDEMCFTIEDEGSGIDKKKQKDLQKQFKNTVSQFEALGMSLSVIKRICNEYDIKLALESEPGQGANFELCFK